MNGRPSPKRRKLDIGISRTQLDSSILQATSLPRPTNGTEIDQNGQQQQLHAELDNTKRYAPSSREAWLEAKAKSKADQGKRSQSVINERGGRDQYEHDNVARARQVPSSNGDAAGTPSKRKHLDPLRNQKASPVVGASSWKSGTSLGFFKQFHKPRMQDGSSTQENETAESIATHGDTSLSNIHANIEKTLKRVGADRDKEDESGAERNASVLSLERAKASRSDVRPKKTFEDEIKAVAEAARQEAEQEGNTKIGITPGKRVRIVSARVQKEEPPEQQKPKRKIPELNRADSVRRQSLKKTPEDYGAKRVSSEAVNKAITAGELKDSVSPRVASPSPNVRLADDVIALSTKPQQILKTTKPPTSLQFSAEQLAFVQDTILSKLTRKRSISLVNLEEELTKISTLIQQTVTAGESNSLLLIGARGSGKTTLINEVIRSCSTQHSNDFHVIRLNGFIHTDDKIALREIWRQLGREMDLDDEGNEITNDADTLTTLLALLSHSVEQGREQNGEVTKSVIFILDEFELFANHPRQTLLYNLFDIAQSRKAPIVVLGLTTRIDVAESLEKRVKSRFSHRYVYTSLPKSFNAFQDACKAAITLNAEEINDVEFMKLVESSGSNVSQTTAAIGSAYARSLASWNGLIEHVLAQEHMQSLLRRLYYTTKSVSDFHASMLLSFATIPTHEPTTADSLIAHLIETSTGQSLRAPDSKLDSLTGLSTLQLALLICAARLTSIHNADVVPFAQAYEEYKVLASKAKIQASASGTLAQGGSRIWSKDVAKGAWEDLVEFGFVIQDGNRGGRVDVGLEEIGMSGVELGSWGRWCREI